MLGARRHRQGADRSARTSSAARRRRRSPRPAVRPRSWRRRVSLCWHDSLKNIFAVADLRKRVLFTLGLLAVYRVGGHIPTPGVNTEALAAAGRPGARTRCSASTTCSPGKNLSQMTIFALGIMPYISASIILQLLTVVLAVLERLSKEGELGRPQDHASTALRHDRPERRAGARHRVSSSSDQTEHRRRPAAGLRPGWGFRLMTVLTLTTGTAFIMWLGEQITERGIGNGMSLIIFAGIVVEPAARGARDVRSDADRPDRAAPRARSLIVLMVAVVAAIIFVERGHRRVTVNTRSASSGGAMCGGSSTHIPLKVNTGGVIPVIFASSILAFPATIAQMFSEGGVVRARSIEQLDVRACRCTTCCTSPASSSSATSTRRSSSTRMTSPRTCGSTAGSSRHPAGQADGGIHRHDPDADHAGRARSTWRSIAILPQFLISGFKVAPIPFIGETARRDTAAVHHRRA